MAFDISRRFMLAGGLSASAATGLAGCTTASSSAIAAQGAFPANGVPDPYLLGPKEGVALLSRNENPYLTFTA